MIAATRARHRRHAARLTLALLLGLAWAAHARAEIMLAGPCAQRVEGAKRLETLGHGGRVRDGIALWIQEKTGTVPLYALRDSLEDRELFIPILEKSFLARWNEATAR